MVRSEATSCEDFAASVPATRGLIAAPWTPASHLPCSRGKSEARSEPPEDLHKTGLQDST